MMLSQVLQAWKAQPVFVSVVCESCGVVARTALPTARQITRGQRNLLSCTPVRNLATGPAGQRGAGGPSGQSASEPQPTPSFWSKLQRTLFPVGPASSKTSAGSPSAATSASPSSTPGVSPSQHGKAAQSGAFSRPPAAQGSAGSAAAAAAARAAREAGAAQRRAARGQEDAFASVSKSAEQFSGTLLKVAVLLITVPLGVHMISNSLLVSLCVKGLESDRQETVALTLKRVRSVIANDFLASRFEEADGVGLLMAAFNRKASEAVLRAFVPAVQQLLQYPSTREALLMSSLVERLEAALSAGWLPEEVREDMRQLHLDAHAARRMMMEGAL